jgi:hypothetical protein
VRQHHQPALNCNTLPWFFYSPALVRFIEATHVEQTKKSYDQIEIEGSAALELAKEPDCYTILASSIAPEIYGHLDVKKSLLLQVPALQTVCVWLCGHIPRFSMRVVIGAVWRVACVTRDLRCSWWAGQIEI